MTIGAGPTPEAAGSRTEAPRVMVVDDDEVLRELLCSALERGRYEAVPFPTAGDAITAAHSGDARVVAAIIDYYLPDMTGLELLTTLRGGPDVLPTIVMSGSEDHDVELIAAGAHAVLHKPFGIAQLLAVLGQVID